MSCEIQATLSCDKCGTNVAMKIKYRGSRRLHNGKQLQLQVPDGWYVDETYTGEVNSLCPAHAPAPQPRTKFSGSAPSASKSEHRDTSNSVEARRGDSRFYTIGGQLIPPRGR